MTTYAKCHSEEPRATRNLVSSGFFRARFLAPLGMTIMGFVATQTP